MNLPYIINVAVILLACLAFYKLLLRRETFYKVNRFFLIACLAISFALPLIHVPQQFSLRKPGNQVESGKLKVENENQQITDNNTTSKINEQKSTGTGEPAIVNQPSTTSNQQSSTFSFAQLMT